MTASRILLPALILLGALNLTALAQDPTVLQDPSQSPSQRGQRGGRGGWGGGGMMGRGVMGTVTEVAPDHFTVKTDTGEIYTIHYSVNTRIMKGGGGGQRRGQGGDNGAPITPPAAIKASDIKIGDAIGASGEIDANAKSVGAVIIFQIDPERAKQMREMQANYGKTWVMGRVSAINDVRVTLQGGPDNAAHTFVADENTTFRRRRDPITLGDVQVGDMVRAEGSIKNGVFLATSVAVMGQPPQRNEGGAPAPQ